MNNGLLTQIIASGFLNTQDPFFNRVIVQEELINIINDIDEKGYIKVNFTVYIILKK